MDGKTYWFADEQNQIVTDGKRSWSVEVPQLKEELSRRMSMIEALEAWKEKARPFLREQVVTLTSVTRGAKNLNSDARTDVIFLVESKLKILSELLGEL